MNRMHKILFLFVAAVLCFGISKTADSAGLNHNNDFRQTGSQYKTTIYPENKPDLVGIHQQAANAVDLLRIPPVQNVKKNSDDDSTNPGMLSENPLRSAVTIYIHFSGTIHQSLSIRELLFPFHHFL